MRRRRRRRENENMKGWVYSFVDVHDVLPNQTNVYWLLLQAVHFCLLCYKQVAEGYGAVRTRSGDLPDQVQD